MKEKGNGPVISEKTDKRVGSIAAALTLVMIGVFLIAYPSFYGSVEVTLVVRWILIVLGTAGFFTSFGDKTDEVKGSKDIGASIVVLAISIFLVGVAANPILAILATLVMLVGLYGIIRGTIFVLISSASLYNLQEKDSGGAKKMIFCQGGC